MSLRLSNNRNLLRVWRTVQETSVLTGIPSVTRHRKSDSGRSDLVATPAKSQSRVNLLEQTGWEIEDWKTTLKVLSDNGLAEKAKPLERMIEEYTNLYLDKRQRRQPVTAG
jgi:hypothetical protein